MCLGQLRQANVLPSDLEETSMSFRRLAMAWQWQRFGADDFETVSQSKNGHANAPLCAARASAKP